MTTAVAKRKMFDLDKAAPLGPDDLGARTTDQWVEWLGPAVEQVVQAEIRTDEMRLAVGLVLWHLRCELPDGDYGRAVGEFDKIASTRTLSRWRALAEQQWNLGAPEPAAVRAAAQTARREDEELMTRVISQPPTVVDTTAEGVPNHHLDLEPPDEPDAAPVPEVPAEPDPLPAVVVEHEPVPLEPEHPTVEAPAPAPKAQSAGLVQQSQARALRRSIQMIAVTSAEELAMACELAELRDAAIRLGAGVDAKVRMVAPHPASGNGETPAVPGVCKHPRAQRKQLGYATVCGACNEKVS